MNTGTTLAFELTLNNKTIFMKRSIIVLVAVAAVALSSFTTNQEDKKALARVQKILGKEVYVLSEPLRDYDIVEKLSTGVMTVLAGRQTIQSQMQGVINRGIKKEDKDPTFKFDAVLTDDGERTVLIKFKE